MNRAFINRICVALVALFQFSSVANCEALLHVVTPKRPTILIQGEGDTTFKLAPELRATVVAGGAFVGVSPKGDTIVSVPDSVSLRTVKGNLLKSNFPAAEIASSSPTVQVDRLIVFLTDGSSLDISDLNGLSVVDRHVPGQFLVLQKRTGNFSAEDLRALAARTDVRYVEPNFPRFIQQNDTYFADGSLWALAKINADKIWSRVKTTSLIVAVIDTGVQIDHPDLAQNVILDGFNFLDPQSPPTDDHGHGTHVSGIIGAIGNNGIGVVGVAWAIKILPIKVFPASGGREPGPAFDLDITKAIDYSIGHGARVINNSWSGFNFSMAVKEAITRAEKSNVMVVAAAANDNGNDNDDVPRYPASYGNKNIISVLSIDRDDQISSFSNYGKLSVHIAAPGGDILSTGPNSSYVHKWGTSQATPFVSGAVALVWSLPEFAGKTFTDVKAVILNNARPVMGLSNKCVTGGVLDLAFAENAGVAAVVPEALSERGEIRLGADNRTAQINGRAFPNERLNAVLRSLAGETVTLTVK